MKRKKKEREESLEEVLQRQGFKPTFKYDEDTGERYLCYELSLQPLKAKNA